VVPPGDAPALAGAIAAVLGERQRFRVLAAEMRAYAQRKYNPAAMVDGHLALYRRLITEQAPSTRGKGWLDPLVRWAVMAYWSRRRRAG
jgi:hypothetical protein